MLVNYSAPCIAITPPDRDAVIRRVAADTSGSLTSLLDVGTLPVLGSAPSVPERDLYVLLAVRNTSAHRLLRSPMVATRFEDLAKRSMFAVLYLVECRYP